MTSNSLDTSDPDYLPPGAVRRRINGGWLIDGFVDTLNRTRVFRCATKDGELFGADYYGDIDWERPLAILFGNIQVGRRVEFCPDAGELIRVGLQTDGDTK